MTETKPYATGRLLSAGNIDTTDGATIGVLVEMGIADVRRAAGMLDERVCIVPASDLEALRRQTETVPAVSAATDLSRLLEDSALISHNPRLGPGQVVGDPGTWSCQICGSTWDTERHAPEHHAAACPLRGVYAGLASASTAVDLAEAARPLPPLPPEESPMPESNATELLPCPFCGGKAGIIEGRAREDVWPHGVFHRAYCTACQVRQHFHRAPAEAIAAWNHRAPSTAGVADLTETAALNKLLTDLAWNAASQCSAEKGHINDALHNGLRKIVCEAVDAVRALTAARAMVAPSEADLPRSDLDALMRDPRYWRDRDPAVVKQVTEGFNRIYGITPPAAPAVSAPAAPEVMRAKILPYTDEDGLPDPQMRNFVMLAIGADADSPTHVLDRIPREAAQVICDVVNGSLLPSADASGGGGVLAEVAAERRRQIEAEGWTPEHDDHHGRGEMAAAAAAYAYMATLTEDVRDTHKGAIWGRARGWFSVVCAMWPWAPQWFKPTDPRRDLIKAGALIVAEIERLDRSAPPARMEG